jgi:hypothetical protein
MNLSYGDQATRALCRARHTEYVQEPHLVIRHEMDPMLTVNRCEHGSDLVAQDRGKRRRSREHRGDLQAHLA